MAVCEKCKNYKAEIQGCLYMDADCVNGEMFEPFTNYDRIRNMSVDEMASFICGIYDEEYCDMGSKFICGFVIPNYDEESVKEWLESEAVE